MKNTLFYGESPKLGSARIPDALIRNETGGEHKGADETDQPKRDGA